MKGSDLVQLLSLPLEILGFVITITETKSIASKQKIESWISLKSNQINAFFDKRPLIPFIFISSFYIVIGYATYLVGSDVSEKSRSIAEGVFMSCSFMLLGVFIFRMIIALFPKRRLLAIGFSLSAIGLFGEFYQVLNIQF